MLRLNIKQNKRKYNLRENARKQKKRKREKTILKN